MHSHDYAERNTTFLDAYKLCITSLSNHFSEGQVALLKK